MIHLSNTYEKFIPKDSHLFSKENIESCFQKILTEKANGTSGYYNLPYEDNRAIFDYIHTNQAFLQSIKTLVIVGIGGSSLGTKAIDALLSHQNNRKNIKIRFLEHTDPIMIHKDLQRVKCEESLFIVISKSGLTIETTSLFKYILQRFCLLETKNKKRLITITDEDSPLFQWSK